MAGSYREKLSKQIVQLADLIVRGRPARMRFHSEQQFLELIGMQPSAVRVRVSDRSPRDASRVR